MSKLSSGKLNKQAEFVTVVLAGGSGTRFWPLSRSAHPKQFLNLAPDGTSLIQATASRIAPLESNSELLVVTAQNQSQLVAQHLPQAKVLAEPMPKNTAACIAYAAAKVLVELGDVPMICLPADHLIAGNEELLRTYKRALELTKTEDLLATIGIPPSYPETGYGYIKKGQNYKDTEHIYSVHSFVEKPNLHLAKEYLSSGDYFWNSGMFIWRAGVIWKAFQELMPKLAPQLEKLLDLAKLDFPLAETSNLFEQFESISIDYGVMEKASNVVMLAGVGFRWSDVGSWSSWKDAYEEIHPDDSRNLIFGDASLINCKDTLIYGDKKFIAGVGLESLIVVDTPDAILVCHRDQAQEVKKIVDLLKEKGKHGLV